MALSSLLRMLDVTTLTFSLLLLPVFYYGLRFYRYVSFVRRVGKSIDRLPGPPRHWLYGNLHQVPSRDIAVTLKFFLEDLVPYGKAYRFWVGPDRPTVVVCHPDSIKEVIKHTEMKTFVNGGYGYLQPWLGMGLLLSSGPTWFRNRKLLTPAFHFEVLKPYMDVNNAAADILVSKLRAASSTGESVEVFQPVSLCTFQVILRCAFSSEDDVQRQGEDNPYVNAVVSAASLAVDRGFSFIGQWDALYYVTPNGRQFKKVCDYIHNVAEDIIKRRRQALEDNTCKQTDQACKDFLDILLLARDEDGRGLTDLEIRQEVDTFLFEGHDTTASGVSWTLYHMARHPAYQRKAQQEVDELLAGRDTNTITWEDVKGLPYLTMCIKESMRVSPPVPSTGRENTKPFTLEGAQLAPNTEIVINIIGLHHNPDVWGSGHAEFRPDRFLMENISKMDSHAFLPFSAGPRNCIGQNFAMHEMKVTVAKILHSFDLTMDDSHQVEKLPELVLRTKTGMKLFLKQRETMF